MSPTGLNDFCRPLHSVWGIYFSGKVIAASFPGAKQEITVPLRDVEIGEHIARYVQDSDKSLTVCQVE